jgi:hypothetical protein
MGAVLRHRTNALAGVGEVAPLRLRSLCRDCRDGRARLGLVQSWSSMVELSTEGLAFPLPSVF